MTKDQNKANQTGPQTAPEIPTSAELAAADAMGAAKASNIPEPSVTSEPTKVAQAAKTPKVSKSADRAKANPARVTMPVKLGLLWLLVILLILAVAALGYWQWQAQSQRISLTTDQTRQSENLQYWQQQQQTLALKLDDVSLINEAQVRAIIAQQTDLKNNQMRMDEALLKALETLAKSQLDNGQLLPQWELAEAEYLLRLANQRLAMEQASESAIALLQAADIIIRDSDQVGTYGVRRAIAADIAALTLVPSIDVEGVYAGLAALSDLASQLTFLPPRSDALVVKKVLVEASENSSLVAPVEVVNWTQSMWQGTKSLGVSVWDELKQLVKVQSRTQADQQLLTPAAELLVRMRIEMAVSQTQVALLRRQQTIYDQSLVGVKQLLSQYYRPSDPVAQSMYHQIDALDEVKVLVSMPNISRSLVALQGFIAALHASPTEPLVGE